MNRLILFLLLILSIVYNANSSFFQSINPAVDSVSKLLYVADFESGVADIPDSLISRLDSLGHTSQRAKARALFYKVRASQISASPAECIKILEEARQLIDSPDDYDRLLIDYQLAGNYERLGNYLYASNLIERTIPHFIEYGDNYFAGNAYLLLGQLFFDINDEGNAADAIAKAKESYRLAGFPMGRIRFFESFLSKSEKRKGLLKQAVREASNADYGIKLQAYEYLVDIYLEEYQTGNISSLDSAMIYSNNADCLIKESASDNQLFCLLNDISKANVFAAKDDWMSVIKQLEPSKNILMNFPNEPFVARYYNLLYLAYEALGNLPKSFDYLKLYVDESSSLQKRIQQQNISKAKAAEDIANSRNEVKLLQQKARGDRNMFLLITAVIIFAFIISIVCALFFKQRSKMRKLENLKLQEKIVYDAQIYASNQANLENNLKLKDCKISSSSLLLESKNEILHQICEITQQFYDEGKVPPEYVASINDVIKDCLKKDGNWEKHKLHFDSVHPDFFINLKKLHGDLTENELKLCAYLRIGLKAKQIAEMLSVSPESVNTSRYRLRKKFGLDRSQSLDDYVRNI